MYSKEPVQQVLGFLAWKMHARVAYHFNSIKHKNPTDKSVFNYSILLIWDEVPTMVEIAIFSISLMA